MDEKQMVVSHEENVTRLSIGVTLKINLGNYQSAEVSAYLTAGVSKDASVSEIQAKYKEMFEKNVYPQIKAMVDRIKIDYETQQQQHREPERVPYKDKKSEFRSSHYSKTKITTSNDLDEWL